MASNLNLWNSGSIPDFYNEFVPFLMKSLGVGEEGSPYQLNARAFKDFIRFRISKEGEEEPLVVDLAPGPMTPWGRSVRAPSPSTGSKYARLFGPEIFIGSENPKDWYFRTPQEAVVNYMEEVWNLRGGTMRGRWSFITGRGAGTAAGSLQQVGPVHSPVAQTEMASRVAMAFGENVRNQDEVWRQIFQLARAGTSPGFEHRGPPQHMEPREFAEKLRPFAPWKADEDITRWRALSAVGTIPAEGDLDWTVPVFGKVKHASVSYMGGTRETVDLMRQSAEGGLEVAQPGLITEMGDIAGYRLGNIAFQGQGPIPTVNRPGTVVTPGSPIPGAMISFEDVLAKEGIYGAFRQGETRERLVTPHIREMPKARWEFGHFVERTAKGGETTYKKVREDLGGMVIPADQSAIIGLYRYQREGREITQPIRVTAEGREIAFPQGVKPRLIVPTGVVETELGGKGHPGVFSDEEALAIAAGKMHYTELQDPTKRGPGGRSLYDEKLFGGIVKAFQAGGGGEVMAEGQESPYLVVPTATGVMYSIKSLGVKAAQAPATGIEGVETPREIFPVSGRPQLMNALLAEIKNPLPQFMGMMSALPGQRIAQSLTELFPGSPLMGRYAERQARAQREVAGRLSRGLITRQQAIQQWPAIEQEKLARIHRLSTGERLAPWELSEEWRQRFVSEAQRQPERYLEQYGFAVQPEAQMLTLGPVTPEERAYYSSRFVSAVEGMGKTAEEAQQALQEYYNFEPIEGRQEAWWQVKSPFFYQTLATPVVPEDLWKGVRFGYEEIAAINYAYGRASVEGGTESLAHWMGLATEQPAGATGFTPPHAEAWQTIGQFYGLQFAKTDKPVIPEAKTAYPMSEEQLQKLAARLQPGQTLAEYEQLIADIAPESVGSPLLYNTMSKQLAVKPLTIEAISEFEGADEDLRAVSRTAKQTYQMLYEWSSGADYQSGKAMAQFATDLERTARSGSKTLSKTMTGRWLRQAVGGRFSTATGIGLHTAVLSQERMDALLANIARQQGISPTSLVTRGRGKGKTTQRWLDIARKQMEQAGGLPGLFVGEPVYATEGGAQAVNLVTPSILRQRGITVGEATRMIGGKVFPGGTETKGMLAMVAGPAIESAWRDVDFDPGEIAALAKATQKGLYIPKMHDPMMASFAEEIGLGPEDTVRRTIEMLSKTGGPEEGPAASGYITGIQDLLEVAQGEQAIRDWIGQPGLVPKTQEELYGEGIQYGITGKRTMGIAYNFRRWVEAAMSTLGFGSQEIGLAKTYGTRSYATALEQKGGPARHIETFMNSIIETVNQAGTSGMIMGKTRSELQHKPLMSRFDRQMAWQLLDVVEADRMVQPEWALAMFSRPGGEYGQMLERLKGGEKAPALIEEMIKSQGYDIGKTPIGLVAGASLAARLTGDLSGRPYELSDMGKKTGEFAIDVLGGQPMAWRGETMNLQAFTREPDIERTIALFQAASGRGGLLRAEQQASLFDLLKSMGEEPPPELEYMVNQLKAGESALAMQNARAKATLEAEYNLSAQPVLRPHAIGLAAKEALGWESAGIGSPKQEARWGFENRVRQVARDVFGISEETVGKMFPSTKAQKAGVEFEEWAAQKAIDFYDVAYFARGGKRSIEFASKELGMSRFIPDIMGVIPADVAASGKPELWMPDIKYSSRGREGAIKSMESPGYGLQIATYAKLIHEAAKTQTPAAFQKTMEPIFEDYGVPEARRAEYAKAWQGAAKNVIRTGIIGGYKGKEQRTGETEAEFEARPEEFMFAQPGAPMLERDWTTKSVQAQMLAGASQIASWVTPESVKEIAPWLMGRAQGAGVWNELPIEVRRKIETVVDKEPGPQLKGRGGGMGLDWWRFAQQQQERASAVPPVAGGGAGMGMGGGGMGGGIGEGWLPPMGDPEEFGGWMRNVFGAAFGEEGIPMSVRWQGSSQKSEIQKRSQWAEATGALRRVTSVGDISRYPEVAGYKYDPRMGTFRGPGGRLASRETVERAISPAESERVAEVERQLGPARERLAAARERYEAEPSSVTRGALGTPTRIVRELEGQRAQAVRGVIGGMMSPPMSTEQERFMGTVAEAIGKALKMDVSEVKSQLIGGPGQPRLAGELIGRMAQEQPKAFEGLFRANKQLILAGASDVTKIGRGIGMLATDRDVQEWVTEEQRQQFADIDVGRAPASFYLEATRALKSEASAAGLTRGTRKLLPIGEEEAGRSSKYLEKFGEAVERATKKALDFGEALAKGEEVSKVASKDMMAGAGEMRLLRRMQERAGFISSEREYFQGLAAGQEPMPPMEDMRAREQELFKQMQAQFTDVKAFEKLQQQFEPAPMSFARLGRRALGGWGLMYMRALTQLPLGQAGYGYQAYEQYLQQLTRLQGAYEGPGVQPYMSPEAAVQWSQIRHGGTTMAQIREFGAGIPAGVRDIGAAGLAGVAAGAGMAWLGSLATGTAATMLGAAAPWAVPIAALGMAGISGLSYARHPERSVPTYAMGTMDMMSQDFLTRLGGTWDQAWVGGWGGQQVRARGANVAALAALAMQGISPEEAVRRGATIPAWMEARPNQGYGIANPYTQQSQITLPTDQERTGLYTTIANQPQFEGIRPEAAAVLARWGTQGLGGEFTMQDVERVARANYFGVDTSGMAARAMAAYRLPETGATAGALERQFQAIRAPWEQAVQTVGMGMAEQTPYGFLEAARLQGSIPAVSRALYAYARGPNADIYEQEMQRYQMAYEMGEEYTPNLPGATTVLSREERQRRFVESQRDIQARAVQRQALVAGLGGQRYYQYALQGQAQAQRAQQALSTDVAAQMYGMAPGTFGNMMLGTPERAVLAQAVAGQLPEMAMLGMERFVPMALQGPGQNMAVQQLMNVQQQAIGITGRSLQPAMEAAIGRMGWQQGASFFQRAMSRDPFMMTMMAQAGAFQGQMRGYDMNTLMAQMDINLQGQITGLAPLTTSLAIGAQPGAVTAANAWAGGNIGALQASYATAPWRQAAVEGLGATYAGIDVPEYMQGQGGVRALQWAQRQISIQAQQSAAGNQLAMLQLQGRYQPLFWNIQDQQRALQHEQSLWGFEMQQRQFEMTGRQFYENLGLQQRQQQMQRQWTVQDWGFEDRMRTMQWGWTQEDFEENVRFMTGRQRRQAERQMERQTIMYGMEGDRIQTQRERQKELWALEDERHSLNIAHFEEQRDLQEENMDKQREFYEEGKKLQDEMTKLQRQYWKEMHELQLAAAGAAAGFAEKMRQVQEDMDALGQQEEDRQGQLKIAQSLSVDMTNAIIDGINYIVENAPEALRSIVDAVENGGGGKPIPPKGGGGGGSSNPYGGEVPYQEGGDLQPGHSYLVGDRGPEVLRMGTIGSVVNQYDLLAAQGVQDRWQNGTWAPGNQQQSSSGPRVLNLYIGNDRLATFVLDTIRGDLEVA